MGFLFGNRVYRTTNMTAYSNGSGGDMLGSSGGCEIRRFADKTILTRYQSKAYYSPFRYEEFEVDETIFAELTKVFRKYRMYHWNNKKFTNMFVCDGASESYSFSFGAEGHIHFSSQFYPKRYAGKLSELDRVIEGFQECSIKLPSLKVEEEEDATYYQNLNHPTDGKITLSVKEYKQGSLTYTIGNGTEEPVEMNTSCELINSSDGSVIVDAEDTSTCTIAPQCYEEYLMRKIPLLEAGTYLLRCGELTATMELV